MNIDAGCQGNGAAAAAADADSDRRRATRGVACQASVSVIGDTTGPQSAQSRADITYRLCLGRVINRHMSCFVYQL